MGPTTLRITILVIAIIIVSTLAIAEPLGSTRDYRDSPHWLGHVSMVDNGYTATFAGSLVLAGVGSTGMDVLRPVSDGFDVLGSVELGVVVSHFAWHDDLLAVATYGDGLCIFDADNLLAPVELADLAPGRYAWFSLWCDDLLVSSVADSLWICAMNPPRVLSTLALSDDADRTAYDTARNLLFTAQGNGLGIINLANPEAPEHLGLDETWPYLLDVAVVHGTNIVLAIAGQDGLVPFDTTDPENPVALTPVEIEGNPAYIVMEGELAYVGKDENLETYDVSDPAHPVLLDCLTMGNDPMSIDRSGNHLVWKDRYSAHLLDLGAAHAVPDTVVAGAPEPYLDVVYDGAYISGVGHRGFLTVGKPQAIGLEGFLDLSGTTFRLDRYGDRLFVAQSVGYLFEISISDPTLPVVLSESELPGSGYDVWVEGNVAWLACGSGGLAGAGIDTPGSPEIFVTDNPGGDARAVAAGDGFVALGTAGSMVWIYDESDVGSGPIGQIDVEGAVVAMDWYGHRIHVATGDGGYRIIDISEPETPVIVGAYDAVSRVFCGLTVHDDVAYIAAYDDGVWALDVSDIPNPRHVGRLPVAGRANGVTVGGYPGELGLIIASESEGTVVAPLHATDPAVAITPRPILIELARNTPNPFNPSTTFRFTLVSETVVDLAIFDLRGRKVTALVSGRLTSGEHVARWHGRDASGTPCASGTYVARLVADGVVASRSISLVK